jgi:hypothetical protein
MGQRVHNAKHHTIYSVDRTGCKNGYTHIIMAKRFCAVADSALCLGCSDGTTSTVLFIGELMKQAERYLGEGLHPRIIVDVSDAA